MYQEISNETIISKFRLFFVECECLKSTIIALCLLNPLKYHTKTIQTLFMV